MRPRAGLKLAPSGPRLYAITRAVPAGGAGGVAAVAYDSVVNALFSLVIILVPAGILRAKALSAEVTWKLADTVPLLSTYTSPGQLRPLSVTLD